MKRSKTYRLLFIAFVLASSSNLRAAIIDDSKLFPDAVSPGQKVTVSSPTFVMAKPAVTAKLYPLGSADEKDAKEAKHAEVTADGQATVTLPDKLPPGRYYLKLTYEGSTEQAPGELRVKADSVKVDSAHSTDPTNPYKEKDMFDFEVIGQNFNPYLPDKNRIFIPGKGYVIKVWSDDKQQCKDSTSLPCLWVESLERLHVIGYQADQRLLSFRVDVDDAKSAELKLTLPLKPETYVRGLSVLILLVLGLIIGFVARI
jgi:hypothetical protein